jgi:hypothetical protein
MHVYNSIYWPLCLVFLHGLIKKKKSLIYKLHYTKGVLTA